MTNRLYQQPYTSDKLCKAVEEDGWLIFHYPEREQAWTLIRKRDIPNSYETSISSEWRHLQAISFHTTREAAKLKMSKEVALTRARGEGVTKELRRLEAEQE